MPVLRRQRYNSVDTKSSILQSCLSFCKKRFNLILLLASALLAAVVLYNVCFIINFILTLRLFFSGRLNSTPETPIIFVGTTTASTSIETTTTTPSEVFVEMIDKFLSYKLATSKGEKPFIGEAQAKILDAIHLRDTCKDRRSTIVADVGANLGEFGLYATACGCSAHIFEPDKTMIKLMSSTITMNIFPTDAVRLYNNVVSDLPTNSTVDFTSSNAATTNSNSYKVQSVQLDDISWPSSIFLLKIDADSSELNVLRSGQRLFREKRVLHLILKYDTVKNDQSKKETLILYLRQTMKPKRVYIFHPTEEKLYGPLKAIHFNDLPKRKDEKRRVVGLYASFEKNVNKTPIKAEKYDADAFFG
ncbi:unnamed protein product [Rotaria socialis]|uniref:Methyltransferase FkbM domain-containing protein n=2 Tax=Rotaria socialis TaxID=392032 RepID=A0A818MGF9_9BILA|nr:unnamed protein product [Rotaria socialis]